MDGAVAAAVDGLSRAPRRIMSAMLVSDFDFDLPKELIAQAPPAVRGSSRLLVLDRGSGAVTHQAIGDLPSWLRAGDLLVVNDTKVFPARLLGHRVPSGGAVECLLLDRVGEGLWEALVHPGQKLKPGSRFVCEAQTVSSAPAAPSTSSATASHAIDPGRAGSSPPPEEAPDHPPRPIPGEVVVPGKTIVHGEIVGRGSFGRRTVRLWTDDRGHAVASAATATGARDAAAAARDTDAARLADVDAGAVSAPVAAHIDTDSAIDAAVDAIGHMPLPPYIARPDTADDAARYQTIYARARGSIAAPTAGLHFTPALLDGLDRRGVERASVTLHVGYGTFKPVRADLVEEHVVDPERFEIPDRTADCIARARAEGRRIVAVGTTTVRALESAGRDGTVRPGPGVTDLFIHPGHEFRIVQAMLTNFHLPRSSLLMLVSALAGRERVLSAYREAVAACYRFYSYGDAMLIV